ncbi:MAG: c-type cytochrome [Campylobacterota bacterium]|nr:c-type cytochrome [Campylobacterota bacterium]
MKKILLTTLALAVSLVAADGYEVYKKQCMSCHVEMMSKKEVMKNIKDMKAPPMVEVSGRLKENIQTTDEEDDVNRYLFILFVKDYIINPNLDNSMCHPGALERFGTMPSLKGKISQEEAQAVAEWLYDRYESVEFK